MTNGEKILTVFPNATTRIYKHKDFTCIVVEQDDKWIADFDIDWWNSEYKEPTTKNDLPHCQCTDAEIAKSFLEDVEAVKDQLPCGEQMDFPSTFDEFAKDYGFKDKDEVYTNGSELIPVFRVKQWLEHISTAKNDIRFNGVKNELNRVKNELDSTTKNNLGVDCIDRQATLDAIIKRLGIKNEKYLLEAERAIYQQILAMPSVTPQLSSELEKNSKKLEKNFGESDCISRQAVLDLIADYDLSMGQVVRGIHALPSVNLQEPRKGHWIYKKFDERTGITNVHICSKCGCPLASPYKSFCSNCGADNREVEE